MAVDTTLVRNIALAGHSGTGKTSIAEAILFLSKNITKIGKTADGNTVSDYTPEEIKRQISINTTVLAFEWQKTKFTVLDLPGYSDFIAETLSGMYAADHVITTVSAAAGIQVGTERVWEELEEMHKRVVVFVNKLDRENTDFYQIYEDLKTKMHHPRPVAVQLPIGGQLQFKGIVDILKNKAYEFEKDGTAKEIAVPADMTSKVSEFRAHLIETIAEEDEALMEKVLNGEDLTDEEMLTGLRVGLNNGDVAPVLLGSAETLVGISTLLQFAAEYLPPPTAIAGYKVQQGEKENEVPMDPQKPFMAKVFKTVVDPFTGKMSFFKIISGTLKAGDSIVISGEGKTERIAHVYQTLGKKLIDIPELSAGMIGVVSKIESIKTGHTLASQDGPEVEFIHTLEPVFSLAMQAASSSDQDKMSTGLHKLMEEDPSIHGDRNMDTAEFVVSGMGDIQLEIMVERMKSRFGVEVATSVPRIAYRETITKPSKAQGKYKKQSGGRGQYGDVHVEFAPLGRGEGFVFEDKIVGGVVPGKYVPAVEKGIRETMMKGVIAGYPFVDFKAALVFGSYHDVDSSEMAFKIAASMSFKEAVKTAGPVILEPVLKVDITVPDESMGDIMGDINSRRGRINGMEAIGRGRQLIKAEVPASEMQKYLIELRSKTGGRGKFRTEFLRYDIAPHDIMEKVVAEGKKHLSDEAED